MLHVLVAISLSLYFPYPAINPLDETERNTILRLAPRRDAFPMAFHHPDHFLEWYKALPLQPFFPRKPKLAHPGLGFVGPQPIEVLFQQVGGIEPTVRFEGLSKFIPAFPRKVPAVSQQVEPLPLDELPLFAVESGVLAL